MRMPLRKKEKQQPTAEDRSEEHQYEMEYRIKTDIDNAFYEVHVQLAKWIKRDGSKNEKVIWAAYKGLEVYYRGYIEATKESYVGTGKKNVTFELLERIIQEVAACLGISGEEQEQGNEQKQVEALRGEKEECEKELRALGEILEWKKETGRVQKEELAREKIQDDEQRIREKEKYEGLVGKK